MRRWTKDTEQHLAAAHAALGSVRLGERRGGDTWTEVAEHIRRATSAEVGKIYTIAITNPRPSLNWQVASGHVAAASNQTTARIVSGQAGFPTLFDPLLVPHKQRNVSLAIDDVLRLDPHARPSTEGIKVEVARHLAMPDADQLRVLVCDGSRLLAWVGSFRSARPFTGAEKQALNSLVPALRARLSLEARLENLPLVEASMGASLEAHLTPVYVVDARVTVVAMNELGRNEYERDPHGVQLRLAEAVAGSHQIFRAVAVTAPGLPPHHLLVAHPVDRGLDASLLVARRRWRLTPRECEVLRLVARGRTNAGIAAELGVVTRSVELHLTHLFDKAGVDNRSRLVARFWGGD